MYLCANIENHQVSSRLAHRLQLGLARAHDG